MTSLTDRYVAAALHGLPDRRRPDLERELRSSVHDAVEDRAAAGEDHCRAEVAVLEDLGDPRRLGARLAGRQAHLSRWSTAARRSRQSRCRKPKTYDMARPDCVEQRLNEHLVGHDDGVTEGGVRRLRRPPDWEQGVRSGAVTTIAWRLRMLAHPPIRAFGRLLRGSHSRRSVGLSFSHSTICSEAHWSFFGGCSRACLARASRPNASTVFLSRESPVDLAKAAIASTQSSVSRRSPSDLPRRIAAQ